jgi:hypothetical protein
MVSTRRYGGIGAIGSGASRFFHPGERIRERYPAEAKGRVTGAAITGEGMRRVARKMQMCYLVRIPEYDEGLEFYIVKKNFRVDVDPETVFESEQRMVMPEAINPPVDDARASLENIVPNVFQGGHAGLAEEIEQLRAEGIEVDDDNEPLPEEAAAPPDPVGTQYNWEKPTFCPRRVNSMPNDPGKWRNHRWDEIAAMSSFDLFRMTMPEQFIRDVIIPATNVMLRDPLTISEFYKWLGCQFYMACFQGVSDRKLWWSSQPIDMFSGAPFRLNQFMTRNRFLDISAALCFTDEKAPTVADDGFVDRFHDVRKMLAAFNDHMEASYIPSWLNCLDESMSSWLSKFCPGFMCVPRKPHPFGNEYHSICDGDDGKPIMWRIKLVEGKDRPKKANGSWAFPSDYDRLSKTAKTMVEMTKPLHGTGKVVMGDSGFAVRDGVIECAERGVEPMVYAKKRGHWPRGVPGDHIDVHFADAELGHCETLVQTFQNCRFLVHCCRDSKYVSKIMATHGMLEEIQDHPTWRKVDGRWKSFKYTEPFSRYSKAKHWVDDHNNRRHDPIGLEEVWGTKWWPMRQFTFMCSVAEVNACHSQARGKREQTMPQLEFRRKLAQELLHNTLDVPQEVPQAVVAARRRTNTVHALTKRSREEGSWNPDQRRFRKVDTVYLKLKCHGCGKKIRTYCSCSPATPLCSVCFGTHINDLN